MKKLWCVCICFALLGILACGTTEAAKSSTSSAEITRQAAAEEEGTTAVGEEKVELNADVIVIGANTEGLTAALNAVDQGAEKVAVLYMEEDEADALLLERAKENPMITLYPDTRAKSLVMDAGGRIHTLRAARDEQTLVISCNAVIVAVNPLDETYSTLLSFLSKCEHGNLLVDECGRGLRNTNLSADAPTKCGVPLAVANAGSGDQPVLSVVGGLYGVGVALCENFEPPAIEDIVALAIEESL